MSNELSIQPAAVQERKNPYVSGAIGAGTGAAVGGISAYVYNNATSKAPQTHEDLVKVANENDKAEFTTKQNAVKDAEKKLEEAGKAVYEGKEKSELEAAKEKLQKELDKLTEEHKVVTKKGGEIVPYDASWAMSEKQRQEYQDLYSKWETAKNNLESSTTFTELNNKIQKRELDINDMYDDIIKDAKSEIKPKSKRRKDIKSLEEYLSSKQGKSTIEQALNDHGIVRLPDKEIIRLGGGESALLNAKPTVCPPGFKFMSVTMKDGTVKYAKVQTSKLGFGRTEYEKLMDAKTDEIAEKVSNSFKTYTDALKKQEKLPDNIKIDKGLLKNLGLKRSDVDKTMLDEFRDNLKTYEADLKTIKDAKIKKAAGVWSYEPEVERVLTGLGVDTPEEAKKVLDAKLGIGRKYAEEEKAIVKTIDDIVGKDTTLANLKKNMDKLKRSDKDLNGYEKELKGKFKKFIGSETTTTTTTALTKEEAMKKQSYKDLAKLVEEKQAAYDKVAANKGKVNESAKKAAEDVVNKAKTELDTLFNDLKGKYSKGGIGKGAATAIAAGAGLVGAMIGMNQANKANKAAEEAATQIIA